MNDEVQHYSKGPVRPRNAIVLEPIGKPTGNASDYSAAAPHTPRQRRIESGRRKAYFNFDTILSLLRWGLSNDDQKPQKSSEKTKKGNTPRAWDCQAGLQGGLG